jgi:hypothetical protein
MSLGLTRRYANIHTQVATILEFAQNAGPVDTRTPLDDHAHSSDHRSQKKRRPPTSLPQLPHYRVAAMDEGDYCGILMRRLILVIRQVLGYHAIRVHPKFMGRLNVV